MNETLSAWLVSQLQARGISQAEFARKSGISQGLVSQTMNHGKPLPMDRHAAVLRGLGLDPEDAVAEDLHRLMLAAKTAAASKPVREHADALAKRVADLEAERTDLLGRIAALEQGLEDAHALLRRRDARGH